MKRQREKIYVSNPLANATGKQYEKSGKTLTLDTSKLGQAGKLTTPQKPYKPEQCSMYILPRYKDFNFSQKGGDTITFNKYVENCMSLRIPRNTLPVREASGLSSTWILGLSDDKVSTNTAQAAQGFWKAYERGYIQKIYDEINKFFEDRKWYDDYLKNKSYYYSQETSGFVYSVIDKNIFAIDLGITDAGVLDNVKVAILRFVFDQKGFFDSGYNNITKTNDALAKKIRDKITKTDAMDFLTLGINRINKAASEAYFNDEYRGAITEPNKQIYNDKSAINGKRKSYIEALTSNANALTDNISQEKKDQSDNTSNPSKERGKLPDSDDFPNQKNKYTNSDKTMLLIAVSVLAAIFLLKRRFK